MNNVFKIFVAIAFTTLIFIGCEKIKSVADVSFETTLSGDLDCVVPVAVTRDTDYAFSASTIIDPTSDPNVEKYLNNIKEYEIQSMIGTITAISENVTLVSSTMTVSNNAGTANWQFSNVPLTVGATLNLDNGNGQWNTVNQILMSKQPFTVSIVGETDKEGVTFTIQVDVKVKVTANPL